MDELEAIRERIDGTYRAAPNAPSEWVKAIAEGAANDLEWCVTEVERLRGVVGKELAMHELEPNGFLARRGRREVCDICSEISRSEDGRWACTAGARLSAALAALEAGDG
jgi:hypothetical protein